MIRSPFVWNSSSAFLFGMNLLRGWHSIHLLNVLISLFLIQTLSFERLTLSVSMILPLMKLLTPGVHALEHWKMTSLPWLLLQKSRLLTLLRTMPSFLCISTIQYSELQNPSVCRTPLPPTRSVTFWGLILSEDCGCLSASWKARIWCLSGQRARDPSA